MRVGIRPVEYYGGFYKNNPTDMEFGSIDCEKAVSVEIKHDEKLKEGELVYFQVGGSMIVAMVIVTCYLHTYVPGGLAVHFHIWSAPSSHSQPPAHHHIQTHRGLSRV